MIFDKLRENDGASMGSASNAAVPKTNNSSLNESFNKFAGQMMSSSPAQVQQTINAYKEQKAQELKPVLNNTNPLGASVIKQPTQPTVNVMGSGGNTPVPQQPRPPQETKESLMQDFQSQREQLMNRLHDGFREDAFSSYKNNGVREDETRLNGARGIDRILEDVGNGVYSAKLELINYLDKIKQANDPQLKMRMNNELSEKLYDYLQSLKESWKNPQRNMGGYR